MTLFAKADDSTGGTPAIRVVKGQKTKLTFSEMFFFVSFVQNDESGSFQGFPQSSGGKLIKNVENSNRFPKQSAILANAKIKLLTFSTKKRWKTQDLHISYFLRFAHLTRKSEGKTREIYPFLPKKTPILPKTPRFFVVFPSFPRNRQNPGVPSGKITGRSLTLRTKRKNAPQKAAITGERSSLMPTKGSAGRNVKKTLHLLGIRLIDREL